MREFSVSLLGLELSTVFIKSLDSGIENVLLTFGEKKCSWERLSLAEGGVRIKNYFVELETEVIMQAKQKKNHTQRQEYQLDKFRMATARWVAVPQEGIWGLWRIRRLLTTSQQCCGAWKNGSWMCLVLCNVQECTDRRVDSRREVILFAQLSTGGCQL